MATSLALVQSAHAATQSFAIDYNFETYPTNALTDQPALDVVEIGDYDLLSFGMELVNQSVHATGVPCHSPPACAVFTLRSVLENGLLSAGSPAVNVGPVPITAGYQYSPISYFEPAAFYYGCVVATSNGAAALPTSCNITVTGYSQAGRMLASQVFTFTATNPLTQAMNLGIFQKLWYGLQVYTLDFVVTNNATTAALIDNFIATVVGSQSAVITVDDP